jgi:hypothetical protein
VFDKDTLKLDIDSIVFDKDTLKLDIDSIVFDKGATLLKKKYFGVR